MASKITFFESYYEAAQLMEPEERTDFYQSMFAYVFDGVEPVLDGRVQQIAWLLVKPNLESSLKKQEVGSLGGRPKSDAKTKGESVGKPSKKPTGKPTQKHTDKPSGKPNAKTNAKTDKDKDKEEERDKEGKKNLLPREDFSSPASSDGAAVAEATPPTEPVCPMCGTPLEKSGMPDPNYWWCDGCNDGFPEAKALYIPSDSPKQEGGGDGGVG